MVHKNFALREWTCRQHFHCFQILKKVHVEPHWCHTVCNHCIVLFFLTYTSINDAAGCSAATCNVQFMTDLSKSFICCRQQLATVQAWDMRSVCHFLSLALLWLIWSVVAGYRCVLVVNVWCRRPVLAAWWRPRSQLGGRALTVTADRYWKKNKTREQCLDVTFRSHSLHCQTVENTLPLCSDPAWPPPVQLVT